MPATLWPLLFGSYWANDIKLINTLAFMQNNAYAGLLGLFQALNASHQLNQLTCALVKYGSRRRTQKYTLRFSVKVCNLKYQSVTFSIFWKTSSVSQSPRHVYRKSKQNSWSYFALMTSVSAYRFICKLLLHAKLFMKFHMSNTTAKSLALGCSDRTRHYYWLPFLDY